ncbi:MAG: copper resistance protein B [Phenylobacterium sp.]|uniref:copper resistance protein B n=1 Tax=Phenylobacterium sp. TaxID=1871053 RepID=UPI0025F70676|nr:copper resistance protein B [Phenylobacterium sp.]MBI1198890.1 copper resistance protein B [Phenylobacterium sp.]
MRTLAALAAAAFATSAAAQTADAPPDPHAGHHMPPAQSAPPPETPAMDPHAHHHMAPVAPAATDTSPPPVPTDHAADAIFPAADMAAARETLRREHGDISWSRVMIETAEYRPSGDGYRWRGRASFGGDIDRFQLKTEGEGERGDLEKAEIQALYSHAIGPNFEVVAGVRQDFQPRPRRTYAALGIEGVAPYWFDVEATAFLSDKGDLLARLEGSYDLRLTQRLILEPRAEANLAAQDVPATGVGSGLSDLELGLRLRYAIQPEFAPYVGINWERSFGDTADFARAAGRGVEQTRFVVGLRAWF